MLGLGTHARRRMRQRGITETEIEEALEAVEAKFPADEYPDERIVIFGSTSAGRRLKIVVESSDDRYVITVADRDDER